MLKSENVEGHFTAFLTIMIWGTTFISTKVLLRSFTPVEILLLRFVIGYIALLVAYPHLIPFKNIREELMFAGAGLCGITLYFLFENTALTYSLASNIGIILSVAPFFVAIMAHFFLDGEKLNASFLFGFAAALFGIALIDFNGSFCLKLNPLGDLLGVLAAAIWAVYSTLMKKISARGYHTISCTRRVFFYGILFMIPAACAFGIHIRLNTITETTNLLNLLFLGLGASAVCFATWNYAVSILGAVKTSVYIYLSPVVTVVFSYLILHEKITWIEICGAVITLAGLVLSESRVFLKVKQFQ